MFLKVWLLGTRSHVLLQVFGPWGLEAICLYMVVASGGPTPNVSHDFGHGAGKSKPFILNVLSKKEVFVLNVLLG